ncbi:MAG: sigma factor-like helix-turn-helix DNA-binding protein [Thermotogota bacterium]|nr:sigma factor-like helix-turn-helix DNA-binding protein [Thermotogota bacterium]
MTLRDIEGLDYQEISNIMDKPLGTIKSRIYYARKRLKKLLEQHGIGD